MCGGLRRGAGLHPGGKPAGSFGDIGTFSFFGNKTVTTGEGGMVIARDEALATDLRLTRGQGMDPTPATGMTASASTTA